MASLWVMIPLSVSKSIKDLPIDLTAIRKAFSEMVCDFEGTDTTLKCEK